MDIFRGHRLLEEPQVERLHITGEANRGFHVVAGVRVDPQGHAIADCGAHRFYAVAVRLDVAADLDLGRAKAALIPLQRFGGRLVGRKDADPGVERQTRFCGAAQIGIDGHAEPSRGEIDARHFDRRLGVEEAGHHGIEARGQHVDVARIQSHRRGREPGPQRA